MTSIRKRVGKAISLRLEASLATFIAQLLIARSGGPEVLGDFAIVLLVPIVMSGVISNGLSTANIYIIGSGRATVRVALIGSFLLVVATVLAYALLYNCLDYAAAVFPGRWQPRPPAWVNGVFVANLVMGVSAGLLTAVSDTTKSALVQAVAPNVFLVAVVPLVLNKQANVNDLVDLQLLAFLAAGVVGLGFALKAVLQRKEKADRVKSSDIRHYLKAAGRVAVPASGAALVAVANLKIDFLLVRGLLDARLAGIYLVATQFTDRLALVSQVVGGVLMPNQAGRQPNDAQANSVTLKATRTLLACDLGTSLLSGLLCYPLIYLVYGPSFVMAVAPVLVLLPGNVLNSASRLIAGHFSANGKAGWTLSTAMAALVLNIAGNLALIPFLGLVGAAIATTIAYTTNLVLRLLLFQTFTRTTIFAPLSLSWAEVRTFQSFFRGGTWV